MIIQKINKQYIVQSLRFDASYHLSEGNTYLRKLQKMPHKNLRSLCADIFTAGRNKRIYTKKNRGFPYLSNSDIVKSNPLDGCKYNSKKHAFDLPSFLKKGMIVTGRVGAIGQTAYITSDLEDNQAMGSDNIIRIVCSDQDISGYVYSFLVSKYGNALIKRLAAGGVQPYISEDMLKDIPVPQLPKEKQKQIHELISEASELRIEANRLINDAQKNFDDILNKKPNNVLNFKQNSKNLKLYDCRLDASYNIYKQELDSIIKDSGIPYTYLNKVIDKIFIPNRGKRIYVKEGLRYLSTSDISTFNPTFINKYLSLKMKGVNTLKVKKNWVLIARSGQEILGSTFLVGDELNNIGVNEHALRVIIDEDRAPYIYAFLSSKFGRRYLRAGIFGSAILTINEDYVKTLLLPELDINKQEMITKLVMRSTKLFDEAIKKENKAIAQVEKEIDSWQVL